MEILRRCYADESGQDVIEYALLLAFVVLTSAALLFNGQASISTIWTTTNNHLSAATSVAL
ncbi:MAG: Flp family type IVb pilin [Bryobacteraceae bacterium]